MIQKITIRVFWVITAKNRYVKITTRENECGRECILPDSEYDKQSETPSEAGLAVASIAKSLVKRKTISSYDEIGVEFNLGLGGTYIRGKQMFSALSENEREKFFASYVS